MADPVANDSEHPSGLRKRLAAHAVPLCLFLAICVSFVVIRSHTALVFNDTPGLGSALYESAVAPRLSGFEFLMQTVKDCFGAMPPNDYRPLSHLLTHLATEVFLGRLWSPIAWLCLVGVIHGWTGLSLFYVAKRYVIDERWALLATCLLLFSVGYVTAAWVVVAGVQAIVPLVICTGLLLYWRFVERRAHSRQAVAALCVLMLVGPWFREYIGLLPLLVCVEELRRRPLAPTWLSGIAGLCLLHAVFPTTLIKLFFIPELPLCSIFKTGSLGATLEGSNPWSGDFAGSMRAQFDALRWQAGWNFVLLFPPMLLILAAVAFGIDSVADLVRSLRRVLGLSMSAGARSGREAPAALWLLAACGLLVALKLFKGDPNIVGAWLCLGIFLLAARRDLFLGLWYLLAFLPFLKVYTEPVHLAYAMVPATIAIAAAIEKLWRTTATVGWPRRFARSAVAMIVALSMGDQALTLYGSYRVVNACNDGFIRVADWLKQNTPRGSAVICNARHVHDIRFFSGGHFVPYWTYGDASDPRAILSPRQLEAFLAENLDRRHVYLLDVDYDFSLDNAIFSPHRFVQNDGITKEDLGRIHVTSVRYPFLDPLRRLTAFRFVAFLGAPDLENDFYRGPALDGRRQYREVFAEYRVFRVTSKRVRDYWYPQGPLTMAQSNFHGYNVLAINSRYFGVPSSARVFNLHKVLRGRCPGSIVGDDLNDVLRRITDATRAGTGAGTIQTAQTPQAVE